MIEALVARGRWLVRRMHEGAAGLLDLREALEVATDGGYLLYSVDARVALCWAQVAAGNRPEAWTERDLARRAMEEFGYQWWSSEVKALDRAVEGPA